MKTLSLWQTGPVFLTAGAWHPLTLAFGLHGTAYAVALLALGIVTSLIAIHRYAAAPSRGRWLTAAIVLTLAILGTGSVTLPALLLIVLGAAGITGRATRRAEYALGVLAAMAAAALLAAPWWLPVVNVGQELVRNDAPPHFVFAKTLMSDHVPDKIASLAGTNLPYYGAGGSVAVRSAGPEIRVNVASRGWNLLASNIPWWNGWRVYWNDDRLPPVRVNDAFLGTFLPPGNATLRLRYRPTGFDTGLRLMAAGLLLLIVTLWWPWPALAAPYAEARVGALRKTVSAIPLGSAIGAIPRLMPSPAPLWRRVVAMSRALGWIAPRLPIPLLIVYSALLITHRVDIAGGADSSGYLNQMRLWRAGHLIVSTPGDAWIPLGFGNGPRPRTMVPTYPPGLPLQLALLHLIGGEKAPFFLVPLAAITSVLLLYRLARDLTFSPGWSVCAATLLALCPVFVFQGVQVMSDVVATCWALAGLVCAFRGARDTRFALLAGACLGAGVLVRPTQILLLPAIVIAIGLTWQKLAALVAGGLPFALTQMAFSRHLYGSPLMTGYGNVSAGLRLSYFLVRFPHYSFWLAAILSPVIFPLGLAGLASRDASVRVRGALVLWFVPMFLFYCVYQPYETWWYTRFLLPAIPAVILVSLWLLRRVPKIACAFVMAGIFALQLGVARHFGVLSVAGQERVYVDAARLIPRDGVIVSMQHSGSIYYYTGRLSLRYDDVTPRQFAAVRAHGEPIYALVSDFELPELRAHTGGEWVPQARTHDVMLLKLRL